MVSQMPGKLAFFRFYAGSYSYKFQIHPATGFPTPSPVAPSLPPHTRMAGHSDESDVVSHAGSPAGTALLGLGPRKKP